MIRAGGFSRPRGPKTARRHHRTGPWRSTAGGRAHVRTGPDFVRIRTPRTGTFCFRRFGPSGRRPENHPGSSDNTLQLHEFPTPQGDYIFCYECGAKILTKVAINVEFHR